MNPLTQLKTTTLLLAVIAPALACFALAPQARAVCQDACLGNNNTVQGDDALISLTTGTDNTAVGFDALTSNSLGNWNTAVGSQALLNNTGSFNTAIGWEALLNNTGPGNTATGAQALLSNTTGFNLTAYGVFALVSNTTGQDNTAIGLDALANNTTGSDNIGIDSKPDLLSPRAYTISTSVIWGLRGASPKPSASARAEYTQKRLSLESVGQLFRPAYQLSLMTAVISASPHPRSASRTRSSQWTKLAKPSSR